MQKTKYYSQTKFSSRIIRNAIEKCRSVATNKADGRTECTTEIGSESWTFDDVDEFLTSYMSEGVQSAHLLMFWDVTELMLSVNLGMSGSRIAVASKLRSAIESVFSIFENAPPDDRLALSQAQRPDATIFIGHGRSKQWEKLKSHLQDKHDLNIVAYETGARAGHTIRDILDGMASESSLALLVLTGEDKTKEGIRARQNVIHECGLFQGRLGFDRAILLVEEGIELASNFDGIQQIRFKKGRISEIFGDVIATIKREFESI